MEALFRWLLRLIRLDEKTGRTLRLGLVLIVGTYAQSLAQEPPTSAAMLPLSISILYFDQSSYQLRPRVKTTLDSIARLLVEQSKLIASVTGYTDTIGQRKLNLALAENRARMVERYLKQRGVPASQLIVKWEGPEQNASANESGPGETISRRVAILLYPR